MYKFSDGPLNHQICTWWDKLDHCVQQPEPQTFVTEGKHALQAEWAYIPKFVIHTLISLQGQEVEGSLWCYWWTQKMNIFPFLCYVLILDVCPMMSCLQCHHSSSVQMWSQCVLTPTPKFWLCISFSQEYLTGMISYLWSIIGDWNCFDCF